MTARELLTRRDCYRHLEELRKALRRRWPSIRWAVIVEFQRRGALHLNLLLKGVSATETAELHEAISNLWCSRVDAEPVAQWVGRVHEGAGLVRYIAQHFLKPGQAPPKGWRGQRVSYSRDYLVRPAAVMREEARSSLRSKRRLWKALNVVGEDVPHADLVELVAEHLAEVEAQTAWELVEVARRGALLEPVRVMA